MSNVWTMVTFLTGFMRDFIVEVRNSFAFTFGFVTVSFFDIIIVFLILGIVINVLWKGGKS